MLDRRLQLHLATWLGQWPAGPGLHVVASHRRARPAWDGRLRPALAVDTGRSAVLSVAPDRVAAIRALVRRTPDRLLAALPEAVGLPEFCVHDGPFRWSRGARAAARRGGVDRADRSRAAALAAALRPAGAGGP